MQSFDFSVPVGSFFTVNAAGRLFRYESSMSYWERDQSITVRPLNGQGDVILRPGQSVRYPMPSSGWVISNADGKATISGRVVIGDGDFSDARSFSVDALSLRSESDQLKGGWVTLTAVAAQYSQVMLWNPVGSLKRVSVWNATYWLSSAAIVLGKVVSATNGAKLSNIQSKNSVGAQGVSEVWAGTNAAPISGNVVFGAGSAATGSASLANPIVLMPGYGFAMEVQTVNIGINVNWLNILEESL